MSELYLRWKVAYDLNGRWEAYRHDGQQPWYVGAADTREAAWEIMESGQYEQYRCASCGFCSEFDFDAPAPLYMGEWRSSCGT